MATYGPGIDQSQHAKSVSHIIINMIEYLVYTTMPTFFFFAAYLTYSDFLNLYFQLRFFDRHIMQNIES